MKPIEQACAQLGKATGALAIMIATRKVSRASVREAADLAQAAADLLQSLADIPCKSK